MRKAWKRIPKEIDQQKEEEIRREPLERGDIPAMLMASLVSIFLPIMLLLLFIGGICYFLFVG